MRLESSTTNVDVFDALNLARDALKALQKGYSADDVAEIMSELDELAADREEIDVLLNSAANDAYDDTDLLKELEALDDSTALKSPVAPAKENTSTHIGLPSVPTTEVSELNQLSTPTHDPGFSPSEEELYAQLI